MRLVQHCMHFIVGSVGLHSPYVCSFIAIGIGSMFFRTLFISFFRAAVLIDFLLLPGFRNELTDNLSSAPSELFSLKSVRLRIV